MGESPAPFPNGLLVSPGEILTFSATGTAGYEPGIADGPAGEPTYAIPDSPADGIAGITSAVDSLLGVFLSNATPDVNADPSTLPPSLDFTAEPLADYSADTFALNQPFLIGSGTNSEGVVRQVIVPAGATRLFLGMMDGSDWSNNVGSFDVTVTGTTEASSAVPTANLALWLNGDRELAVDGNGNVTSWGDLSVNDDSATASGVGLTATTINGHNAVAFNGSADLELEGLPIDQSDFTIFSVATDTGGAGGGNREIVSNWTSTRFTQSVFLGTTTDGTQRSVRFTDDIGGYTDPVHNDEGVGSIPDPSSPFILTGTSSGRDASVSLDGGVLFDRGSALSTRDYGGPYTIGEQGSYQGEYWEGDIAELLVYNGTLSSTDTAAVYTYLEQKYDIPAASTATTAPVKTIGGLDPSFGDDGLASHDVGFTATDGVAEDGTQSVLIGPIGDSPDESFGVTRYNGDGSLDTTFGSGGVVATSFDGTDDVPNAVAVLPGGNILVAGTATTFINGVASGSEFAVAEYTSSGALDTSFGSGGQMLISFSSTSTLSNDVLKAIAVTPAGTIYLAGSSDAAAAGNADLAIASLTSAGNLNTAFATTGKTTVDVAGGDDVINSVALQKNGDIVAAGSATVNGVAEVALARFLVTGKVDPHFGTRGLVTASVGGVYDSASSVVIQSNGEIVIGGLTASGSLAAGLSSNFLLQRYTTVGRLDRTFGTAGTVITNFGQPAAVTQLVLQSNGEIVASGKTTANLTSVTPDALDVALARYSTRGTLDTSFNQTGTVIVDLSAGEVAVPTEVLHIDASTLGAEFDAFTSSLQGVVTVSSGGEILDAGNSGADTVEAELVAAGVDLLAKLLSSLPAAVLGGLKASATISITESGTQVATGVVTVTLEFADDAFGDGATTVKTVSERINLKQSQSRSYRLSYAYPSNLASGQYYLLASVADGATLSDLNMNNNTAASASAVDIAPPFIALTGSGLSAPSTFTPGKPATVSVDITNTGNVAAAGRATLDLYFSPDQTTADAVQMVTEPLPLSLGAGKSRVYRFTVKLPRTAPLGTFNLLALIDPANSLGSDDNSDALVVDATQVTVA